MIPPKKTRFLTYVEYNLNAHVEQAEHPSLFRTPGITAGAIV